MQTRMRAPISARNAQRAAPALRTTGQAARAAVPSGRPQVVVKATAQEGAWLESVARTLKAATVAAGCSLLATAMPAVAAEAAPQLTYSISALADPGLETLGLAAIAGASSSAVMMAIQNLVRPAAPAAPLPPYGAPYGALYGAPAPAPVAAPVPAPAAAPLPTEDEIRRQFDLWNAALATCDEREVADLYAPSAVLLPTISNKVRSTRASILDYFRVFLEKKPQGVVDESHVKILAPDLAAHYGIYTFSLRLQDGTVSKVAARFSFTYRKYGDQWLIVEHHSSALPESTTPLPSEDEIRRLFDKWNAALATLDPTKVADCYASNAVLLPTVSNEVRTTRDGIVDYFTNFLERKPQGEVNESHVQVFNADLAAHYGIYTFSLTLADGSVTKVKARFSYTYRRHGKEWLIAEHHSSALPESTTPMPTEQQVRGLFDKWNAALATLDAHKVADLYASNGVLLPTVSNEVRITREGIVNYFERFLQLKPQGEINESHVSIFSPELCAHYGIYTFTLTNPDGTHKQVTARFSYTYRKQGEQWLIAEHHSSALPEATDMPTEEIVRKQFDLWNAALRTGDPTKVADLYAPNGILLPTVSNEVRTTREGIIDYFTLFLTRSPQGVVNESHVQIFTADLAAHYGIYTFTLHNPDDGTSQQVSARFSYTYKKYGDRWLIQEHHSSALPEKTMPTEAEITAQFDLWNAALATLDPNQVADLYAPNAVLLPTVSNKVRTCRDGIVDYFSMFLQRKPQGVINESHVHIFNSDVAAHYGVYTFTLHNPDDGTSQDVSARFSFTYRKFGDKWLIKEHHSSALPEKVPVSVTEKTLAAANM